MKKQDTVEKKEVWQWLILMAFYIGNKIKIDYIYEEKDHLVNFLWI